MSNRVIFWTDISDIPDPAKVPEITKGLSQDRIDKIFKLRRIKSRKQSLCSGLMQKFVAESYGKSVDDIFYGEHGKPMLEGVYFSISHSDNLVICAVSDIPVGCDIEHIKSPHPKVGKRCFHHEELAFRDQLSPNDCPDRAFYRLWVAKESYQKMTGEGFSLPFNKFKVCLSPLRVNKNLVFRDGNITITLPKEFIIPGYDDYVVFVCTDDRKYTSSIEHFSVNI